MSAKRRQRLVYQGATPQHKHIVHFYKHPTLREHIAPEQLDLKKMVYFVNFHGFNLIANRSQRLLDLCTWMIEEASIELENRKRINVNT
ncbi:hypothetical protein F8M41_005581 [Gigaspora margarita]|uniref:Uncharacterized protein n=1 Tax=Gigaspora margarita TaxID=4874 RepID=A0A8H3X7W3_GIGMA|nr:hypothetical protein F8M41_005581 [Gigaspora margarita]